MGTLEWVKRVEHVTLQRDEARRKLALLEGRLEDLLGKVTEGNKHRSKANEV